ncbi:hypothetical protein ACFL59_08565 [Planctomycetota bacterium]
MRLWIVWSVACCLTLVLVASQARAQEEILLSDGYADTTPPAYPHDVNDQETDRQSGSVAPKSYSVYISAGAKIVATNVLRFYPSSSANLASVSPNQDFKGDPGANRYFFVRFDMNPDSPENTPTANESWIGLTLGNSQAHHGWTAWGNALGFKIFFRDGGGSDASFGSAPLGSRSYTTVDDGFHTIEVRVYDPAGGSPWDGSGATRFEVYVDGAETPYRTHTKASPGYTNNYITLYGQRDSGTVTHDIDNLEIGYGTFPPVIPEPSPWGLLTLAAAGAVVLVRLGGRRA